MIKTFDEIIQKAKSLPSRKIAVVCPHDEEILLSLKKAAENGLGTPVLFGDTAEIKKMVKATDYHFDYSIVHCQTPEEAAAAAVEAVSQDKANMLMKGLIGTTTFLKAVVSKTSGIKPQTLLSHLCVTELKKEGRIAAITDGGMNIHPTLAEKKAIIENALSVFHRLENKCPKVAVLCAVEVENPKMPETVDARMLTDWYKFGGARNCIIEGPLALDNALSREAAEHKGIKSQIAGEVDIFLVPDITSGNILGKSMIYLTDNKVAGIIAGASVPIILTSRSDTPETKFHSIALAQAIS